jgi:hypothetical protein
MTAVVAAPGMWESQRDFHWLAFPSSTLEAHADTRAGSKSIISCSNQFIVMGRKSGLR